MALTHIAFRSLVLAIFGTVTVDTVACSGGQADIVFILDSSSSVGPSNFLTVIDFTVNITDALDIGEDTVRVGAIRYSSSSSLVLKLDAHYVRNDLKGAIRQISYVSGGTDTAGALRLFRNDMKSVLSGARLDTEILNIGILVTDGQSNDPIETKQEANLTRADGNFLITVGIGNSDLTELNAVASTNDSVFYVSQFRSLQSVIAGITKRVCAESCRRGAQCNQASSMTSLLLAAFGGGLMTALLL